MCIFERDGQRLIRIDNNKHNKPPRRVSAHAVLHRVSLLSELSLDDHHTNCIKVTKETRNVFTDVDVIFFLTKTETRIGLYIFSVF